MSSMKPKIAVINVLYVCTVFVQHDSHIGYIKLYLLLKWKKDFKSSLGSDIMLLFYKELILLYHFTAYLMKTLVRLPNSYYF